MTYFNSKVRRQDKKVTLCPGVGGRASPYTAGIFLSNYVASYPTKV